MKPERDLTKKVKKTILRFRMIRPGEKVVVAVSGGADSVCLLHVLHRLSGEMGHKLVVAHYDHGWRPGEDQFETDLVRNLAAALGLPVDVECSGSQMRGSSPSREETARLARYAFLTRVREKHLAHKIAVGHHLDDQAETLLMRLLRGSGGAGLGAIPPVRDETVIRPLIEVRREEVEAYLDGMSLSYAVDSSNRDTTLLRNRIRKELVPLLLRYQPRLAERLGGTASILREESEFLNSLSDQWIGKEAVEVSKKTAILPVGPYVALPAVLRRRILLRSLLAVKGDTRRISRKHIDSVDDLTLSARPQTTLNLPDGVRVIKSYDTLKFTRLEEAVPKEYAYSVRAPGTTHIREIGRSLRLAVREKGGLEPVSSPWTAHLDAEKARFPMVIRNFRQGDRFVPLGMKGRKKLKDFFVDLKVPSALRRSTPMLVRDEIPLWVAGFRIDERFKVTPDTRMVLEACVL